MALAEGGLRGEVRDYGRIANTPAALERLVRKLGQEGVETAGYEGIFFCIIRLLGVLSRRSLELSHQLVGTHMK